MPNNHSERKSEIDNKFKYVCWGQEYKATHAIAAIADVWLTGGTFTINKIKDDAKQLGIDIVNWAIKNKISLNDTVYCGNITISHWENLPFNNKLKLPNSFRVYIAVNKK